MDFSRFRVSAVAALAFAALLFCGAYAQAWASEGLVAGSGATIEAQASGTDLKYEGNKICVYGVTSGKVAYSAKSKTLTLDNVRMDSIHLLDGVDVKVRLIGKSVATDHFVSAWKNGSNVKVLGSGSVSGCILLEGGNLTAAGGKIAISKATYCAISCKKLTVNGGSISLKNGSAGNGIICDKLTVSKGKLSVSNQDGVGIHVRDLLKMTGGALSVTKSQNVPIWVSGNTFKDKSGASVHSNGIAKFTGGKVTATLRNVNLKDSKGNEYKGDAIAADRIQNKLGCFKKIKGMLGNGATFKAGQNVFSSAGEHWTFTNGKTGGAARVAKYNAKSKTPTFNYVKFGGCSYGVKGFDTKAFATKRGAKVTAITLKQDLCYCNKNALAGAKSLKKLKIAWTGTGSKFKGDKLKSVWWMADDAAKKAATKGIKTKMHKKAFSGCNANLLVKLGPYGVPKQDAGKYRKLFTDKDMPESFTLKAF